MGGPILKNKMFFFGSANYQATHVKVPDFPTVVPSYIPTPLSGTSDQDTTRHRGRRRQDHLSAGSGQPLRGLSVETALRQAEPRRRRRPDAGVGLEGARHVRHLAALLQPRADRPRCSSTRRRATTTRTSRCTRRPICSRSPTRRTTTRCTATAPAARSCSAAVVQAIANCAVLPAERSSAAVTSSRAGFDNGYTPEDVDTLRVDDVNLTFRSLPTPTAATVHDLQHAAAPGARRHDDGVLRPGLLHASAD